jgi:tetratricopeptide (TPR) repeat protein
MVLAFQETMKSIIRDFLDQFYSDVKAMTEWSIRGDEVCIILYTNEQQDALRVLELAILLKVAWLVSNYNEERIKNYKPPIEIGIGINTGPVIVFEQDGEKEKFKAEGYAINVAKRVETHSRDGHYSRIMVSYTTRNTCREEIPPWIEFYSPETAVLWEGKEVVVFEIKNFWLPSAGHPARKLASQKLSLIKKATSLTPALWLYSLLGDIALTTNEYNEAVHSFLAGLELEPESVSMQFDLAVAYYMRDDYGDARLIWERLDASAPRGQSRAVVKLYLGLTCQRQRDYIVAENAFKSAPLYDSECQLAGNMCLCILATIQGKYDNALKMVECQLCESALIETTKFRWLCLKAIILCAKKSSNAIQEIQRLKEQFSKLRHKQPDFKYIERHYLKLVDNSLKQLINSMPEDEWKNQAHQGHQMFLGLIPKEDGR